MTVTAVLGAQWGDEGKGKLVDVLARDGDIVARFSGGNNAGHTVITEQGEFKFHLLPSGVVWPHTLNVIGNGVVVDPDVLLDEITGLEARGISIEGRLIVSERSHLVMPYHVVLDQISEQAKGRNAIGTTGRGIGPAYADKASRIGIRATELRDIEALLPRLEEVLSHHNAILSEGLRGRAALFGGGVRQVQAVVGAPVGVHRASGAHRVRLGELREAAHHRGRAGRASRPGSRHLSVRHVLAPDHRWSYDGSGAAAGTHRQHTRRLQGVQHPRGKRPVRDGASRLDGRGDTPAGQGVRHDDGQAEASRLVRLGGGAVQRAHQRLHGRHPHAPRRAGHIRLDHGVSRLRARRRDRLGLPPATPRRWSGACRYTKSFPVGTCRRRA